MRRLGVNAWNVLGRVAVTLGTSVAYILAFLWLYPVLGLSVASLATLLVTIVAWFFGMRAGLIAALLSLPLHTLLANVAGDPGWDALLQRDGGLGTLALALVGGIIGRLRDLSIQLKEKATAHEQAEAVLRQSEASLARAQQIAHLGTWEVTLPGGETWWSDETYRIFGVTPHEFVPTSDTFLQLIHPHDREIVAQTLEQARLSGRPDRQEYRIVRPDGEVRFIHEQSDLVRDDTGQPSKVIGVVLDITARKRLEAQLMHQAFHDPLTGLPNRALFLDRFNHALERAASREETLALLFLDLDRFKVINDNLGHEVGDQLLVRVAERLRDAVRPVDTVARLGGDEFTVLLEDIADERSAISIASRIIEELRRPIALGDHELFTAASIGIVLTTGGHADPSLLMRSADIAMYHAKASGKGRYQVFAPHMTAPPLDQLVWEADLRRAIEADEFEVCYQPIVHLATGAVVGFEALARWLHPQRGTIPPTDFIPLAEETGLILLLGQRIVTEACRQAQRWQSCDAQGPSIFVAVNLSAKEFTCPTLVDELAAILRTTGLPPSCLHLEITESVAMDDAERAIGVLEALKGLGVQLAIDDFGTGYSSLSYLQRFPVNTVKIDRSFVGGLGDDNYNLSIVRAITSLAQAMNLGVTAEGIETASQLAWASETQCDWGQGYYFSEPLSPDATLAVLRETRLATLTPH